jgi:hypothetical protein
VIGTPLPFIDAVSRHPGVLTMRTRLSSFAAGLAASLPAIALVMAGLLSPAATVHAAEGHCNFQQYAPEIKQSFQSCAMPSTPAACSAMSSSRNKSQSTFGQGYCSTAGVAGVCIVNSQKVYFYRGDAKLLEEGCRWLHGIWRPDLMMRLDTLSTAEVLPE